jgi:hypothetical protein
MEDIFNELNNDDSMIMMATADAGFEAVDNVIVYYSSLLEQAIYLLCEQMDMDFEQMVSYLEEKADKVNFLDTTLNQLQAVIEVSKDLFDL